MNLAPSPERETPTTELVIEVLDQTRELVRLEVRLARNELREEVDRTKAAAVYLGAGAVFALVGGALVLMGVALAIHVGWVPAFVLGIIVLALGGAVGFAGYAALPKKPLEKTKARLETDLHRLEERAA